MTYRESILFNLLQDARKTLTWIHKDAKDLDSAKTHARIEASAIKIAIFSFAYGASSETIKRKIDALSTETDLPSKS